MRPIPSLLLIATAFTIAAHAAPLHAQRKEPVSTIPKPAVKEIPRAAPRPTTRDPISTIPTPPPKRDTTPTRRPPVRDGYGYHRSHVAAAHWAEPFARVDVDLRCADSTRQLYMALAHAMASHRATLPGHSGPAAETSVEYVLELHAGEARGTPAPFPAGTRIVLDVDGVATELPVIRDCRVSHSLLSALPTCGAITERELDAMAGARAVALRVAPPGGGTCSGALVPGELTLLRSDVARDAYRHTRVIR